MVRPGQAGARRCCFEEKSRDAIIPGLDFSFSPPFATTQHYCLLLTARQGLSGAFVVVTAVGSGLLSLVEVVILGESELLFVVALSLLIMLLLWQG